MISSRFPIFIRCCWFGLNHLFRDRISGLSLTTVQYTVLRTIHNSRSKKLNQRAIANSIATNKNNLSSIIKRLEEMKYIKIVVNPKDKRESQIVLCPRGNSIFLESKKIATELQVHVMKDFNQHEIKSLTNYLARVNVGMSIALSKIRNNSD